MDDDDDDDDDAVWEALDASIRLHLEDKAYFAVLERENLVGYQIMDLLVSRCCLGGA
jgi:hypothetical protein